MDHFDLQHFFLKKPNTSEYAQVLVVAWAKLNSVSGLTYRHDPDEGDEDPDDGGAPGVDVVGVGDCPVPATVSQLLGQSSLSMVQQDS